MSMHVGFVKQAMMATSLGRQASGRLVTRARGATIQARKTIRGVKDMFSSGAMTSRAGKNVRRKGVLAVGASGPALAPKGAASAIPAMGKANRLSRAANVPAPFAK